MVIDRHFYILCDLRSALVLFIMNFAREPLDFCNVPCDLDFKLPFFNFIYWAFVQAAYLCGYKILFDNIAK